MKQIEILLHNKEKIILIGIPDDAYDFRTVYEDKYSYLKYKQTSVVYRSAYGDENEEQHGGLFLETSRSKGVPNIELLGEYNPITGTINFEVKEEWVELFAPHGYRDYSPKLMFVKTLKDSFLSLLKSETKKMWPLKENIEGLKPKKEFYSNHGTSGNYEDYETDLGDWNELESRVMPKRFIVLHVK